MTLISSAHGEDTAIEGVYDSREAAFEGLKEQPNMTVWVSEDGSVRGRPKRERRPGKFWTAPWMPVRWAVGRPMPVRRHFPPRPVPSFTCPACGMISHHPEDVRQGYCAKCHDWTGGQRLGIPAAQPQPQAPQPVPG